MLSIALPVAAQWTNIATFPDPISSGFFFDELQGMIGSGIRNVPSNFAAIYLTTDGGVTWTAATTPRIVNAAVTCISMVDHTTGYASVYCNTFDQSSLWKTTNGGSSWVDASPKLIGEGTSVFANTNVIVLTQWQAQGVVSTNGGPFLPKFSVGTQGSNGVDFADPMHGVVTMGPNAYPSSYFTSDGGASWNTTTTLPESWGVYALKGTSTYFAAAEGSGAGSQRSIYQSPDGGASWKRLYTFADPRFAFTGHLAGGGNSLYAQTDDAYARGMVRSDDLGKTWKFVNGPYNSRDTRFVVTGCAGNVVYAFDEQGNVWKTTNGGDGTLIGGGTSYVTIAPIPSVKAGEHTLAKINLAAIPAKTSVTSVSLHISFNGDVLTPEALVTMNTLSQNATVATFKADGNKGVTIQITLPAPLTSTSDLSLPLVYLDLLATLSDSLATRFTLDQSSINTTSPLALCSPITSEFTLTPQCGDSTISYVMNSLPLLDLVSIIPNPSNGGVVTVSYSLREPVEVSYQIVDAFGVNAMSSPSTISEPSGTHTLAIPTGALRSGTHFLQLRTKSSTGEERTVISKLLELR